MYIKRPLLLMEVWKHKIFHNVVSHEMNLNRQQSIDLSISIWQVQLGIASGPQWAKGYEIGKIVKINRME